MFVLQVYSSFGAYENHKVCHSKSHYTGSSADALFAITHGLKKLLSLSLCEAEAEIEGN
jgi:hypothetical protein